ncbi:TonB-dependent receptor [Hymenobacter sp. BT683]|uniref:TonB-dependent receptor n=1 Tax=Hymenobacter jeongseonensis TaxID=2791027 RepID=A0ABS0IJN4_9BACT|nr:TonB-dependent receptor [Hymenobacter jeongseonensis]MBF9238556.1 TonB-dependent receptor [Hymenobacter jeongseonensis]
MLAALMGTTQLAAGQQSPGARPAAPSAPTTARAATGRITGTVSEAGTGKPVSYATVAVLDAAGKVVNGGVAGDDGKFILAGIPAGSYTVQISFIGYKNEERTGVAVPAGGPVDLGTVSMATSAQKLGEVVVVAQKPLIEERVDRTVYNAENDQTAKGGDASDVLRRVPLLSVDLDGNVSLRGSSNIRVLINNKPSAIAASSIADALRQIPADQIKSVEVITSPSAKYDAEGSGGIINIITKTNTLRGGTLGVDVSAGTRSANLGLNGSYRTGKMGFSLNAGGRAGYNIRGGFENRQTTISPSNPSDIRSTLQTAQNRQNQGGGRTALAWDYDINKQNSLQASFTYGLRASNSQQDRLTRTNLLSSSSLPLDVRNVDVEDRSNSVDASLNFTHLFEKPQQEFSLLTQYSRNDRQNDFTNSILDVNNFNTTSRLRNENPSANEEFTVQADYQSPVGKTQLLEFGAKDILRKVSSDFALFTAPGSDGAFTRATGGALNNGFNYRQNVAAAYATYTVSLPKNITLKPGLRYEYTTITADFNNTDEVVSIPAYGALVPGVNLSRRLTNGNVVKLAYNRRLQRPSLQFLNPAPQFSNSLIVSQGNPELQPEFTNNYELGYSTLVKQVNLNFSAFVRNTTGSIQSVRSPLPEELRTALNAQLGPEAQLVPGAQLVSFGNIGEENAYGGNVFASLNGKKLSLNSGIDVYYAVLRNNVADRLYNASNKGFVASGRLFGSYKITDLWGLQAFGFYRGRQVELQGEQSGFGFYGLSVRREFANKKGSFGFGAQNFLTPSIKIRNEIRTPLLTQNSINERRQLSFQVNFSYRIGQLSADQRPRRRRGINNDDLKGDGGGGDLGGGEAPAGGGGGGGGARPAGGAPAGVRPVGAPGTRPGGAPGAPAGTAPTAQPGTQPLTAPTDSTTTDSTKTLPAALPGTVPAQPLPTVQPATPATQQRPAAPLNTPVNPINNPANAPSPGTTTPGGITPAGSTGGRP